MPKLAADVGVNAGITGLPGQQGGGMGVNPLALNPLSLGMNAFSGALSGVLGSVITQQPAPAPKHHHEEPPPAEFHEPPAMPVPPPAPPKRHMGRIHGHTPITDHLHPKPWGKIALIGGGILAVAGGAYLMLRKKHH